MIDLRVKNKTKLLQICTLSIAPCYNPYQNLKEYPHRVSYIAQ